MKTRGKDLGTGEESRQVTKLHRWGYEDAERLAEGGSKDLGDVRFTHPTLGPIYIESKARTNYNQHKGLRLATAKVVESGKSHGFVAVWWKRLVKKEGYKRRVQEGKPVVILDEETFGLLLRAAEFMPPEPSDTLLDWAQEQQA